MSCDVALLGLGVKRGLFGVVVGLRLCSGLGCEMLHACLEYGVLGGWYCSRDYLSTPGGLLSMTYNRALEMLEPLALEIILPLWD